ncbi:TetR/AcrR family transcriptional regulator [Streptomyces sp. NBC_01451]|uniref:TetR/AcrR family transcriptional regulator n=1 Tax=Streptomyces sp. NBC_01451 TaxID=2903872 RepID=UPI002E3567E5|nr:TetR/AcrR family transcriptional regulator [Streptomyces sp. NBC_01451]
MTSGTDGNDGTKTSGSGDIARTLELLWDTGARPSRGPRPGLTIDRIVETAVRIADEEGLDAVSMRRVSTELGTGTMSLYRYVPGKGELLDLMLDRVQRRSPATPGAPTPPADDGGWRGTLEAMARSTLDLYRRHPWLLQVNQSRPILGPGTLDGLESVLTRIRPMGLPDPELVSAVVMVDGYVVGAARTQVHQREAERRTGLPDREFWRAQLPFLEGIMATGRYPALASLTEDTFDPAFDHFEFGLQRVLDGLEAWVEQRGQEKGQRTPSAATTAGAGAASARDRR